MSVFEFLWRWFYRATNVDQFPAIRAATQAALIAGEISVKAYCELIEACDSARPVR